MAAFDARQFRRMVLVAPTGIRPPTGEIKDLFTVPARTYLNACVHNMASTPEFAKLYGGEQTPAQFEAWEDARAEAARIAWEPYMFDPSLPELLEGVAGLPTLLCGASKTRLYLLAPVRLITRPSKDRNCWCWTDAGTSRKSRSKRNLRNA